MTVAMPRSSAAHEEDFVDADELRELLALTRGHKIELLLAQECAVSVIVRDPSRTDAEVEAAVTRIARRKVLGRARIAVVRERMRASGLIPSGGRSPRLLAHVAALETDGRDDDEHDRHATRTTQPVQGTPSRSGFRPSAW